MCQPFDSTTALAKNRKARPWIMSDCQGGDCREEYIAEMYLTGLKTR